jgi:hypothetical protein
MHYCESIFKKQQRFTADKASPTNPTRYHLPDVLGELINT